VKDACDIYEKSKKIYLHNEAEDNDISASFFGVSCLCIGQYAATYKLTNQSPIIVP
jgi:hypothetical protein